MPRGTSPEFLSLGHSPEKMNQRKGLVWVNIFWVRTGAGGGGECAWVLGTFCRPGCPVQPSVDPGAEGDVMAAGRRRGRTALVSFCLGWRAPVAISSGCRTHCGPRTAAGTHHCWSPVSCAGAWPRCVCWVAVKSPASYRSPSGTHKYLLEQQASITDAWYRPVADTLPGK
eukprot:g44102.t1